MKVLAVAGVSLLVLSASAAQAAGAAPLFPKPFHVVREIDDSLTGHAVRLDEYYAGDRVISIRGERTTIADYAKQELTEIDRGSGTWSSSSFAQLANARGGGAVTATAKRAGGLAAPKPALERKGSDRRAGRPVELFAGGDESLRADVAVDPSIALSKEAFDVIAGATFPKNGGPAVDLVRGAARSRGNIAGNAAAPREATYGLPVEQTLRFGGHEEAIVVTNRVLSIDDRQPAPDLIAVPPGARRVEARAIEAARIGAESQANASPSSLSIKPVH